MKQHRRYEAAPKARNIAEKHEAAPKAWRTRRQTPSNREFSIGLPVPSTWPASDLPGGSMPPAPASGDSTLQQRVATTCYADTRVIILRFIDELEARSEGYRGELNNVMTQRAKVSSSLTCYDAAASSPKVPKIIEPWPRENSYPGIDHTWEW